MNRVGATAAFAEDPWFRKSLPPARRFRCVACHTRPLWGGPMAWEPTLGESPSTTPPTARLAGAGRGTARPAPTPQGSDAGPYIAASASATWKGVGTATASPALRSAPSRSAQDAQNQEIQTALCHADDESALLDAVGRGAGIAYLGMLHGPDSGAEQYVVRVDGRCVLVDRRTFTQIAGAIPGFAFLGSLDFGLQPDGRARVAGALARGGLVWAVRTEAMAHAFAVDSRKCAAKLLETERLIDKADPDGAPGFIHHSNQGWALPIGRGFCSLYLARWEEAASAWTECLSVHPADRVRDRGLFHGRRALAYLLDGHPDAACAEAQLALPIALETGSARIMSDLRTLRATALRRWPANRS